MTYETNVLIPGRLSYVNVWEPKVYSGNKAKYSLVVIIPKTDKETLNNILKAIEAAKQKGLSKFGGVLPNYLNTPLKDGDDEKVTDPNFKGCYFINASDKDQPKIVDRQVKDIIDRNEVYSGCYANVSVNMYAYNSNNNKGISAALKGIQKVKDGEAFAGVFRPEEAFKVLDKEDDFLA